MSVWEVSFVPFASLPQICASQVRLIYVSVQMNTDITPTQMRDALEAGRKARAEAFANGLAALFGRSGGRDAR